MKFRYFTKLKDILFYICNLTSATTAKSLLRDNCLNNLHIFNYYYSLFSVTVTVQLASYAMIVSAWRMHIILLLEALLYCIYRQQQII